jgi:hypothetical protein
MAASDEVTVYKAESIAETAEISLSRGGMVLIALLSGGDYDPACL